MWLIILTLIIALSALVGAAVGKYIKTSAFNGELLFKAELAEQIQLLEHNALRKHDGSYVLGSELVTENAYTLIPGLDIPKDPHVIITNKTSIEAFLYVEVVDQTDAAVIQWQMGDQWLLLAGVDGKKEHGAVYVYAADGHTPTPLTRTEGDITIHLLKDDTISVSQTLLSSENPGTLRFYAAMGEVNAVTAGTAVERATVIYMDHVTNVTP